MEITIKKVSDSSDGGERFVLVETSTRRVITVHDTSAEALRRFFASRGVEDAAIVASLEQARKRYAEASRTQPVVDQAKDTSADDLLSSLGLDEEL